MPKGSLFLRRPDFFGKGKDVEEGSDDAAKYFDPAETDEVAEDAEQPDLRELNQALRVLVDVFPNVEPDVFREMLLNLSEESRLEVVTEHLLRNGAKFVQGRYRKAGKKEEASGKGPATSKRAHVDGQARLLQQETFRSEEYKLAVKNAFYQEFKSLSHSTIRAVMAERNYSYTLARPTLQQINSKSWRYTIVNFWSRKRANTSEADCHPLVEWQPDLAGSGVMLPCLKRTKSLELNRELYDAFIAPVLSSQKEELLRRDQALADQLNEAEAEQADAMYECECCYTAATFEQIATCDDTCHFICFRCIRHAISEALYGQGWARNIDAGKASLRCLAPSMEECQGCISPDLSRRALLAEPDGQQTWHQLEERIASETLIKSQLPLQTCPFCSYAELDEQPSLCISDPITVATRVRHVPHDPWTAFSMLAFIILYPILFPLLPLLIPLLEAISKPFSSRLRTSQARILRKRRGLRFQCRSSTCARASCTNCLSPWRDPHACHADSLQSLRQAIETATTHSIKRVCPKCNLSFVKASGCNKLVCNCGYVMCYVCRQEIGFREGYSHFCQHFRERPGTRCRECDKCDLYVAEDEDGVIKRAAQLAEKEWIEREASKAGTGSLVARDRAKYGGVVKDVLRGKARGKRLDWDDVFDAFMDACLA
ncbi:hypothetical protein BDV97DRAFT_290514 [Delphinella strobiligena]|nr:hypothetical protein BDV97DRAFT_290514 [Delphinella strobiligena]